MTSKFGAFENNIDMSQSTYYKNCFQSVFRISNQRIRISFTTNQEWEKIMSLFVQSTLSESDTFDN